MVADFERVISLGRELGQHDLEIAGHHNLGEFLYWMERLDDAAVHLARAHAVNERWATRRRSETVLLEARIALYRGDMETARTLVARLRGDGGALLAVPAEDVLCSMIELATSEADSAAWDALEERASAWYSAGHERIEVIEARGMFEARRGRFDVARIHYERALELATQIPNVLRDRVLRRLARLETFPVSNA